MTPRNEHFLEKPLPSSEESERVILGAILLDNSVIGQAVQRLTPGDFYSPLHRRVFAAMIHLFEKHKQIDPILVGEELKKEGSLEAIGGITEITNLTFGLPHFSNIAEYIKVVRDKAAIRNLIRSCDAIRDAALAEEEDTEAILDHAERTIFRACERPSLSDPEHLAKLQHDSITRTAEHIRDGILINGVSSGLIDLDNLLGGARKTDLVIVAGRPSMGKSILALKWAYEAASESAVSLYFSLEMSKEQVAARTICMATKTDLQVYMNGSIMPKIFEGTVTRYNNRPIAGRKLFIDDTPGISTVQIMAKARRAIADHKRLDLIVVDYLQLMSGSGRSESRQQEVSKISRELKALAKELNVPVIAVSQLSRAPETRSSARPLMSDLRESGSIEQDADAVIFIYREAYYKETEENKGLAEIIVAKQRNGPTGTVRAAFLGHYVSFENFYDEDIARAY